MCVCVCVCARACVYVCVCTHTNTHKRTHTHTNAYKHIQIHRAQARATKNTLAAPRVEKQGASGPKVLPWNQEIVLRPPGIARQGLPQRLVTNSHEEIGGDLRKRPHHAVARGNPKLVAPVPSAVECAASNDGACHELLQRLAVPRREPNHICAHSAHLAVPLALALLLGHNQRNRGGDPVKLHPRP